MDAAFTLSPVEACGRAAGGADFSAGAADSLLVDAAAGAGSGGTTGVLKGPAFWLGICTVSVCVAGLCSWSSTNGSTTTTNTTSAIAPTSRRRARRRSRVASGLSANQNPKMCRPSPAGPAAKSHASETAMPANPSELSKKLDRTFLRTLDGPADPRSWRNRSPPLRLRPCGTIQTRRFYHFRPPVSSRRRRPRGGI